MTHSSGLLYTTRKHSSRLSKLAANISSQSQTIPSGSEMRPRLPLLVSISASYNDIRTSPDIRSLYTAFPSDIKTCLLLPTASSFWLLNVYTNRHVLVFFTWKKPCHEWIFIQPLSVKSIKDFFLRMLTRNCRRPIYYTEMCSKLCTDLA